MQITIETTKGEFFYFSNYHILLILGGNVYHNQNFCTQILKVKRKSNNKVDKEEEDSNNFSLEYISAFLLSYKLSNRDNSSWVDSDNM